MTTYQVTIQKQFQIEAESPQEALQKAESGEVQPTAYNPNVREVPQRPTRAPQPAGQ